MLNSNLDAIVPMLCITLAALVTMIAEAFRKRGERMPIGLLGIMGLLGAAASSAVLWDRNASGFGVIVADNFGLFVTLTLVVVGILTIMFSGAVVARDGLPQGEYYSLILFSLVGMIMMATANDLLVVFVALEVLSLGVYVLTGIRRDDPRATGCRPAGRGEGSWAKDAARRRSSPPRFVEDGPRRSTQAGQSGVIGGGPARSPPAQAPD